MKPEDADNEKLQLIAGDVIGDTAYSERFVLKLLLKLANLDTLKHELQGNTFEGDLCILWDMTAERDVVLFLHRYDVLSLLNFVLPEIISPRIIEILIGIAGNMCCQKEVVEKLLTMEDFLNTLMEYSKYSEPSVLIQLLRLINSCLYLSHEDNINIWMKLFLNYGYSDSLYFILYYSSDKDLLITALENFNTICSYCNIEKHRIDFFSHFITEQAVESLSMAFQEITFKQRDKCDKDTYERILVVTLQIALNVTGFDKSPEIYADKKDKISVIIHNILLYYKNKLVKGKEIDSEFIDIIESSNTITDILKLGDQNLPETIFDVSFKIWKTAGTMSKPENCCDMEEDNKEFQEIIDKMKSPLSRLICLYISQCADRYVDKVLDSIGKDYEGIIKSLNDEQLKVIVTKRTDNYRRLKESVDS